MIVNLVKIAKIIEKIVYPGIKLKMDRLINIGLSKDYKYWQDREVDQDREDREDSQDSNDKQDRGNTTCRKDTEGGI